MWIIRYFAYFSLLFLVGCTTSTNLEFSPSSEQKLEYTHGSAVLKSFMPNSAAYILKPDQEVPNGGKVRLVLAVFNASDQAIDVSSRNISVVGGDGENVRVYSHAEAVKEEKQKRDFKLLMAAIGGAADAYNASQAGNIQTTGTYNSTTYGNGSTYMSNGTFTATTYDPNASRVATELANQRTERQVASIQHESTSRISSLNNSMLRRTTLSPNQSYSGDFIFEGFNLKKEERKLYQINVRLGNDVHTFNLYQSR